MPSVWEVLGERVGYGLATIVLGPHAALQRRTRRQMRAALVEWSRALQPTTLETPRGTLRRGVSLRVYAGEPRAVEVLVDLAERTATMSVAIDPLPTYVEARFSKNADAIAGAPPTGEPLVVAGELRAESASLDVDATTELLSAIAGGPLARLPAMDMLLESRRIVLRATAPTDRDDWEALGDGLGEVVNAVSRRWATSYRR